jgi:hypothetical protein
MLHEDYSRKQMKVRFRNTKKECMIMESQTATPYSKQTSDSFQFVVVQMNVEYLCKWG